MDNLSPTPTDTILDLAEEAILTHTVSDEALEAAAGAERGAYVTNFNSFAGIPNVCC